MAAADRLDACLRLAVTDGVGPLAVAAMLARFGSPEEVFLHKARVVREAARSSRMASAAADRLLSDETARSAEYERQWARAQGVRLLTRFDSDYPPLLLEIPDPPVVLWVRGDVACLSGVCVAVVGSRRASVYGRGRARALAAGLAAVGVNVVSGAAYGIDQEAHEAALSVGGRTTAVLACGLGLCPETIQPDALDRIARQGAVVSELPSAMGPQKGFFPRRNRIVSGLSVGIVVVEAAAKSGALITAEHAADQGRAVFAVPGPADSPTSQGTHGLIRNGATLAARTSDILREIAPQVAPSEPDNGEEAEAAAGPSIPLTPQERCAWDVLQGGELGMETLAREAGLPPEAAAAVLLTLELKGLVRRQPGARYRRT